MAEYQSNSHRSKELQAERSREKQERNIQKVVSGPVKTKENGGRKLANIFISDEASSVKEYVLMDVIVPNIKKVIVDVITDAVSMVFLGDKGRGSRSASSSRDRVSYRRYYDEGRNDRRDGDRYSARSMRWDYDDIIYPTRRDAEAVRDQMFDVIEEYGLISVADMYEMAGINDVSYTANNYGWTNIRASEVVRVRDGFIIKLPKAVKIEL